MKLTIINIIYFKKNRRISWRRRGEQQTSHVGLWITRRTTGLQSSPVERKSKSWQARVQLTKSCCLKSHSNYSLSCTTFHQYNLPVIGNGDKLGNILERSLLWNTSELCVCLCFNIFSWCWLWYSIEQKKTEAYSTKAATKLSTLSQSYKPYTGEDLLLSMFTSILSGEAVAW